MALVALTARLIPALRSHTLTGIAEYDDGVHLAAALRLVHGDLPYHDFVFVQPPGITVLLSPFAVISGATGELTALVLAKLVFMVIGAVNAALLCIVIRRERGDTAGVAAGLLYAVWLAAARAESTVLLEPLLNLALLGCLLLLGHGDRRASRLLAAGAVLGLGITMKVWLLPVAGVVAVWVVFTHGRDDLVRWLAGLVGTCIVVAGPFFLADPSAMWREVVRDQLGRGRGPSVSDRLALMTDNTLHLVDRLGNGTVAALMALAIAVVLVGGVLSRARLWVVLGVVQLGLVIASPSFYYHYSAFPALPIAALFGITVGWVVSAVPPIPARVVRGATALALTVIFVFAATERVGVPVVDRTALAAFVADRQCVWADWSTAALVADRQADRWRGRCRHEVDQIGRLLDATRGRGLSDAELDARRVPVWQRGVRAELAQSDGVILVLPLATQQWDSRTRSLFSSRFRAAGRAGDITLWARR